VPTDQKADGRRVRSARRRVRVPVPFPSPGAAHRRAPRGLPLRGPRGARGAGRPRRAARDPRRRRPRRRARRGWLRLPAPPIQDQVRGYFTPPPTPAPLVPCYLLLLPVQSD
jgi:hypothetical protein